MITPIRDNVLIKVMEVKQTGPVYLPNVKSNQAEVMAVGPGGYTDEGVLITPQVKVGDIVVVSPRILEKTDKVDVEGEEMLLLKEGFILGILEA